MTHFKFIPSLILACGVTVAAALPTQAEEFSKSEIETIVRNYILENPTIISEAIYILQRQAEQERAEKESLALKSLSDALNDNPLDPVGGNPEGSVTLVEFFDYNCGYCKRSNDVLQELIEKNPNLKVVYKEWPILSEASASAASIALAVNLAFPKDYEDFHRALLNTRAIRSEADVWKVVEKLALSREKVEAQLNSVKVKQHLQQTKALAQQLGITGTPAFIIGDSVLKGAYPIEDLQRAIDRQREG